MAFKILITDASTPLARKLLNVYEDKSYDIVWSDLSPDQWADVDIVKSFLSKEQPALVLNTFVHSEFCEQQAFEVNQSLAQACNEFELKVIHISSHEVFSPEQSWHPLDESSEPKPENVYGQTLKKIEDLFLNNPQALITRLPWVLDLPDGLLESALKELRYQSTIQACESWFGSFLSISEISRVLVGLSEQALCDSRNWGVVHLHSSDRCSEVEFVDYLQRILDKEGVPSAQVNLVSYEFRLLRSGSQLIGNRCTNGFGIQFRSWRQGVKKMVLDWLKNEQENQS